MSFLIDLFRWFLTGSSEDAGSAPAENEPSLTRTEAVSVPRTKKSLTNAIDFDLDKGANVSQFLNDIRSIEPISKQFSDAREELLSELKKLAPRRKK